MKIRDRYGDVREVPEAVGRLLVQRGAATAVKPTEQPEPKPKPAKAKK
jgi:hypothetical protein